MLDLNTIIIAPVLPLGFHATKSHAEPTVEFPELNPTRRERCREIARHASNDCVKLLDVLGIQVVAASGQFPHPGLEFLHGFGAHFHRVGLHVEPQKGKTFREGRQVRLIRTQLKAEPFGEELLDRMPCLFRLTFGPAEDDEVIGVSHKVEAEFVEVPVQEVQGDVRQQRRELAANNLAKRGLMFHIVIARSRLKPSYGQGSTFRQDSIDKEVT